MYNLFKAHDRGGDSVGRMMVGDTGGFSISDSMEIKNDKKCRKNFVNTKIIPNFASQNGKRPKQWCYSSVGRAKD